ncbi:MAG: TetR/AcrR family transcriptional regulator [Solirubrobacterales bacterium]
MSGPTKAMKRLPPGRHGLSREVVRESQRLRLTAAAAESLAEQGYGGITVTAISRRAGVSTSTFYQRFDDIWGCLLAAHESAADRLCERIEAACAGERGREERARAGISAALSLLASEPALAQLLSAEPPSGATSLWAARLRLSIRLGVLLHGVRRDGGGREARLVGGALSLVSMRARAGGDGLEALAPALTKILLAP